MASEEHDYDEVYMLDDYEDTEVPDADEAKPDSIEEFVKNMPLDVPDDKEEENENGANDEVYSDRNHGSVEPEYSEADAEWSSSAVDSSQDGESLEPTVDSEANGDNGSADGVDGNEDRLLAKSEEVVGDQTSVQEETQSAFSDSSSDSDDWDMDAEIEKGRARTANMVARMNGKVDAAENNNGSGSSDALQGPDVGVIEPIPRTPFDESSEAPPEEEQFSVDKKKPWVLDAQLDGALLPIGGDAGDDIYRRDMRHWRTGGRDCSRFTSQDPRAYEKPSLLSDHGTFTRLKSQLNQERWQRHQIQNDFEVIEGELYADRERIEKLKHAVDTRDEELKKGRVNANRLGKLSELWKTAFERQRPLADAERERQALIEAGHEYSQDASTQTSPVETGSRESTEKIAVTNAGMHTDNDDLVAENLADLASERDELLAENNKLADQVSRFAALLTASKEWIEARDFKLKGSTKNAGQNVDSDPSPVREVPRAQSHLRPPGSASFHSDLRVPLASVMLQWPEHWIEREREIRRSASWIQARDTAAAELNSWTKQIWASAGLWVS